VLITVHVKMKHVVEKDAIVERDPASFIQTRKEYEPSQKETY
jgi:hypothetical protein